MKRFLSVGYAALVLGGALLALGSGLTWIQQSGGDPFSQRATTTVFVVGSLLRLLGAIGMLLGFTAIAAGQADRAGRLGLVAYVLVVVNMVLQVGWMWADSFLSGALSRYAPAILDGDVNDARMSAAMMTAWILNTSILLLGVAVLRARVFGRLVGWSLVVAGGITLLPLPVDGPGFEVIIGVACLLAGLGVLRSSPAARLEPALA